MIPAIKRWLAERKRKAEMRHAERDREAEAGQIAWNHFHQAHPSETLAYGPYAERLEGNTYVVFVPFGATEPFRQSLWRVDVESQTAEELSYGQITPEPAEIIEMIEAAFDGVPKPEKITLRVARAADDYVPEEKWPEIRALDSEARWQDVSDKDLEKYSDVDPFLDASGFRYYLPAFMIWCIRHHDTNFDILFMLEEEEVSEKLQLLTREQRGAIAQFLKFVAMACDEALDAAKLYELGWKQYDVRESPPEPDAPADAESSRR